MHRLSKLACRHGAAGVVVNDTFILHGGTLLSGRILSDIWYLDLNPALEAFQAHGVTCRNIQFYLKRGNPCAWKAPSLTSRGKAMAGHVLGAWEGYPDMLLSCGGISGTAVSSQLVRLPSGRTRTVIQHRTRHLADSMV